MTRDEQTLVEWVVWEVRVGDLPEHVQQAARRLASRYPRPERLKVRAHGYTEGPLTVTGFPRDETKLLERRNAWPHQAAELVREFLDEEVGYVLVCDNTDDVA